MFGDKNFEALNEDAQRYLKSVRSSKDENEAALFFIEYQKEFTMKVIEKIMSDLKEEWINE
ncbi:MAG: hypothetical protein DRJ15_07170 [Bacteroidetes bacterium]|nr:MAG: hypothetical protein DRJ15_07170 [Bacteroidota bacterium]